MEMNDDQRLLIAIPYLLMVVIGLLAIILPMWARTLGILGAVTGACGLVWTCWGSDIVGWVFRLIPRWHDRNAPAEPSTETIGPIGDLVTPDRYLVLGVPCEPEIYDEMKRAVADGLRISRLPSLEKPHELF